MQESIFQKNVLTLKEVVQYTGWKPSFIYKLTMTNKLRHSKPNGKTLFFERAELERFLMGNPVKLASDIAAESASYIVNNGRATR